MPDEKGHSRQCPALRHEALWFLFFRPGGFGFFIIFFTGERGDVQSEGHRGFDYRKGVFTRGFAGVSMAISGCFFSPV